MALGSTRDQIKKQEQAVAEELSAVEKLRPERAKAEALAEQAMASLRGKGEVERALCSW